MLLSLLNKYSYKRNIIIGFIIFFIISLILILSIELYGNIGSGKKNSSKQILGSVKINKDKPEILVKYKKYNTPEEIETEVEKRREKSKVPIIGYAEIALENMLIRIKGDRLPEEKLKDLQNVENEISVENRNKLIDEILSKGASKTDLGDIRTIKTNGKYPLEKIIEIYSSLPEVEYVEPNISVTPPSLTFNDPYYNQQWNLPKMKTLEAWDIASGSATVTIANIDTGVDYNHPDLTNSRIIRGYDFADNDGDPFDDSIYNGHGTGVTGIIIANANNGAGVVGIDLHANLLAVKVYGRSGGSYDAVVQGISYAADQGAKIINVEVQSQNYGCSNMPTMQTAIDYARSLGSVVISAAGNYNQNVSNSLPASCNGVVAVGALTRTDTRASYSNYGAGVDVAAPAGDIGDGVWTTTIIGGYYGFTSNYSLFNGTSAATPHVSAAAALLIAQNPSLTPDQIETALKNNGDIITTDLPVGKRINIYNSLLATTPTPTPSPTPTPTPSPSPTPALSPDVISINPNVGVNNESALSFIISGNNFQSGLTVILRITGQPDVDTSISSVNDTTITGEVNLNGLESGIYDVVVTNPNFQTGILENGFTVNQAPTPPPSSTAEPTPTPIPSTSPTPTPVLTPTPSPEVQVKEGDLNTDNKVNVTDLSILLRSWGKGNIEADFNKDGVVNVTDLSILLRNWTI